MREIFRDIRELLKNNAFTDEQHVRFSLVGRICSELGWNIWNPQEFFTEFRVKRLPKENITKTRTGLVDVALFIPEKVSEGAEVFIEVKAPGKLDANILEGEDQLHLYNAYHKSAISILTDGIKWRFYLPSAGGEFEDKLFLSLNLLEDDLDVIVESFNVVLRKENYRKKVLDTAELMRKDRAITNYIEKVRNEANDLYQKLNSSLSIHNIVQNLINTYFKLSVEIKDIKRLWDCKGKETIESVKKVAKPKPSKEYTSVDTGPFDDYRFTKVQLVKICGQEEIKVRSWAQLKKEVYNYLIKNHPNMQIEGVSKFSRIKTEYHRALELIDGYYTEKNLDATSIVRHVKTALKAAGYDPEKDLIIGYERVEKK